MAVKTYSAAEAAAELGIDAKKLRSLVRDAPSFKNAGSGGRYTFRASDMPALRRLVAAHQGKPKTTRSRGKTLIADAPGLPILVARNDPAAVRAITEERVDRLEAALKATGKHISQMRNRETWRTQEEDSAASA
jgi:hypothetical protein